MDCSVKMRARTRLDSTATSFPFEPSDNFRENVTAASAHKQTGHSHGLQMVDLPEAAFQRASEILPVQEFQFEALGRIVIGWSCYNVYAVLRFHAPHVA